MVEEKPLTLYELARRGIESYRQRKQKKQQEAAEKETVELEGLRKHVEELKTEKRHEEEKQKLLAEIEQLKKEVAEKKIGEVVE
jgi:tRNA C32,U32 (ribose-2'-O)-methylase TrmJ